MRIFRPDDVSKPGGRRRPCHGRQAVPRPATPIHCQGAWCRHLDSTAPAFPDASVHGDAPKARRARVSDKRREKLLPVTSWPTRGRGAGARWFQPVTLGPVMAATRTWVPAMVPWRSNEAGEVTADVIAWYERFARGRPGVLVVEATGIRDVPSGPLLRAGDERFVEGLTASSTPVQARERRARRASSFSSSTSSPSSGGRSARCSSRGGVERCQAASALGSVRAQASAAGRSTKRAVKAATLRGRAVRRHARRRGAARAARRARRRGAARGARPA